MNGLYSMMRRERDIIQEAGEFFDQAGNRMEGPYVALFTDFMTGDGQIISDIDDFRERMEEIGLTFNVELLTVLYEDDNEGELVSLDTYAYDLRTLFAHPTGGRQSGPPKRRRN